MKINAGRKEKRSKKMNCQHCQKTFEIVAKDLEKPIHISKDYKLFRVNCPCCNKECFIRDVDISFKI